MPPIVNYIVKQNPARICPSEIFDNVVGLRVPIWTPAGAISEGIVEVHRRVAQDVDELFKFMVTIRFPVAQARPVREFGFSDSRSMLSNNTSAFNYRTYISKSSGREEISGHSYGDEIDINPFWNPDMQGDVADPIGAQYIPSRAGTLTSHSRVTLFLKRRGWIWGGDWERHQDYQHFGKPR